MTVKSQVPFKVRAIAGVSICAMLAQPFAPAFAAAQQAQPDHSTRTHTPIQHVILIIGENRTFDHIFATYKPTAGETVDNLLSKKIINADGTPGPNFPAAHQFSAIDDSKDGYRIDVDHAKQLYPVLPPATAGGPKTPYLSSLALAQAVENGLDPNYYQYLLTGGTGQTSGTPDTRIPNASSLPPGPFQLTSSTLPYDAYTASPVHRFYQMWQQLDCSLEHASRSNPSGCLADLFPWVETTVGAGSNGKPQPAGFNDLSTKEGSTSMAFYNVQNGDAPYLKMLADNYAMSDNYHQAAQGGTGANHIFLGFGDDIFFSDAKGKPAVPPHNQLVDAGTANAGVVDEIENPNAQPGTNNYYIEDGYGGGSYGSPSYGGGSYSNCSDASQPGVRPVLDYLGTFSRDIDPRCQKGAYYILNNYNPGYFANGNNAYTDTNANNTPFTIPPTRVRSIGDELSQRKISWAYYGDQFNRNVQDPYFLNPADVYCNICNPFQYSTSIMTNAAERTAHLKDTTDLYAAIQNGTLPAVSYVKPSGLVDGHPASSKLDLYEGFVKKIVDGVKANPTLWASTAIFVTFDEGGGYYDSGYVQPLDFFGDGTRIPMIVVSKYTKAGHISHVYSDHVSFLKFVEANWGLPPVTNRSRDNFPNPVTSTSDPYVPLNGPAIGDLMDLFHFDVH